MKTVPMCLLLFIILLVSCVQNEPAKKVSLTKRSNEKHNGIKYPQHKTLWFGFDLRLGPKEEVLIYTPFLNYLEKTTGRRFRIKFTEKYEDTVSNLGKGITHFAALGSLSYVLGHEKYGIQYLVSGVNSEGDPTYHSIIFTKPDSLIQDIHELKQKCFAFGSRMSTQGHIIPRSMLEQAGISLTDLEEYIYTGSHLNAVKSVLNGECDAGGIQDTLAKRLVEEGTIKIIKMSQPYPSSLVAYNSSLDAALVKAVKEALLAFEPMDKHKTLLHEWSKTEMSLGFTSMDEIEFNRITDLAKKYDLLLK
jgi:phosphonate transport system substrate-binding protein